MGQSWDKDPSVLAYPVLSLTYHGDALCYRTPYLLVKAQYNLSYWFLAFNGPYTNCILCGFVNLFLFYNQGGPQGRF